jgi:hypothetical protein
MPLASCRMTSGRGMSIPLRTLTAFPTGCRLTEERVNSFALFVGRVGLQEMEIH